MDIILFFGILLILFVLVLPIIANIKANLASRSVRDLQIEMSLLKSEVGRLKERIRELSGTQPPVSDTEAKPSLPSSRFIPAAAPGPTSEARAAVPPPRPAPVSPPAQVTPAPALSKAPAIPPPPKPSSHQPPPLPVTAPTALTTPGSSDSIPPTVTTAQKAPATVASEKPVSAAKPAPPRYEFNLEQFMGMKLFAWIGGLALFIGIVLFVKYAFERNLISPAARTGIGAVLGAGLASAGVLLRRRERYRVLAHTLAATGVLVLYGVSFAGHILYELYSQGLAFGMAVAVTAAAFLIAVRMEARVVAVLGILGGFLAPVLLSTGQDRAFALTGYIAALDVGILALVHFRPWRYLTGLAALGTGIMVLGWLLRFWEKSGYAYGSATLVPAGILLFFPALFCAAGWWLTRRSARSVETLSAASGLSWLGLILGFPALSILSLVDRPWLLFGYLYLQYAVTGLAAWRESRVFAPCIAAGGAVFLTLAIWSWDSLTHERLPHALGLFFVFGAMQTVFPLLWRRAVRENETPSEASAWMPLPVLLLVVISALRVPDAPVQIWLSVAVVNLLMVVTARFSQKPGPLAAGFSFTMAGLMLWLYQVSWKPEVTAAVGWSVLPVISLFGVALTVAGLWLRRQWGTKEVTGWDDARMLLVAIPALASLAALFTGVLLLPGIVRTGSPWLYFSPAFALFIALGHSARLDKVAGRVAMLAAPALFLVLLLWFREALYSGMLFQGLGLAAVFGGVLTAMPLLRKPADQTGPAALTHWMPLVVLPLLWICIVRVPDSTTAVWGLALAVNAGLLLLGRQARRLDAVVAGSGFTGFLLLAWLLKIAGPPEAVYELRVFFLWVLGIVSIALHAGALWARKGGEDPEPRRELSAPVLAISAPLFSAQILLLVAALVFQPPPWQGLAGLSTGLALLLVHAGAAANRRWFFPAALAVVYMVSLAVEWVPGGLPAGARTGWHAAVWMIFLTFPFLRRTPALQQPMPWAVAAFSSVLQFLLILRSAREAWPSLEPGIIPALCALPPAAALLMLYRNRSTAPALRLSQLAWFGGVVLLFITAVIPIQWEKHWITLGWALEGAALCWLYRRVPHEGLRLTGAALLGTAFARLVLNPATFSYYPRLHPIWNWQLYTYGIAIAAHVAAICFLSPPRHRCLGIPLRASFQIQAGILIFYLINLEIADFFTATGSPYISWEFSGNFARDMTVTIAWGLYSFSLVAWGLWKQSRGARYAGIGLMGITLLKLFLFDLAGLDSIYRIAVTIVVAIIALGVSFLYQRFSQQLDRASSDDQG